MMVEDLIYEFHRCNRLSVHNPTPFHLEMQEGGGVITKQVLPARTMVGEIHGVPMYVWDISHTDYMIVGDEFVLDVSGLMPRSVLTYIREDSCAPAASNCLLVTEACPNTGDNRFFLTTIRDIHPGEELVYVSMDYPYY